MDDITPKRAFPLHIVLLSCTVGVMATFGGLRLWPHCLFAAGPVGFATWARLWPNIVCSLDLSAQGELTGEGLGRMDDFDNLQELNLSGNGLTEVPVSVAALTRLERLDVSGNALRMLPETLGGLHNLRVVNAENNDLTDIPASLRKGGLESLNLALNPLSPETEQKIQTTMPDTQVNFQPGSSSSSAASSPKVSSVGSSASSVSGVPAASAPSAAALSSSASPGAVQTSSFSSSPAAASSSLASAASSAAVSTAPPLSSSSAGVIESFASLSSSTSSMLSNASSIASSSAADPVCTPNSSLNGYVFCIPDTWTGTPNGTGQAEFRENGVLVAVATCPLEQANYDDWTLTTRSRTYLKDGQTYGSDVWWGTPKTDGGAALLLVFLHKHDFGSWFGDNYRDVGASCQIQSLRPDTDQNIFWLLSLSAY